ncbi:MULTISPECIES: helix-turn-helix transcriptional regulator [unclassified Clostridium]|uniref:helix-turn-helix domain-containing protein n=1 Tax=Clostridium TaxID=1485 RepID=UPI000E9A36B3|nr:XRE family transcriptional regulator [Clostridium sp.]
MEIGKKIKFIRKSMGINQNKLAQLSGISNTYLSDIENLRTVPSLKTLNSLAIALEVSLKDLLD